MSRRRGPPAARRARECREARRHEGSSTRPLVDTNAGRHGPSSTWRETVGHRRTPHWSAARGWTRVGCARPSATGSEVPDDDAPVPLEPARARRPRRAPPARPLSALLGLCLVELLSWGVLYYSLPVAAPRIAAAEGWSSAVVPSVYALSLLAAAAAGPRIGRLTDTWGPRAVMTAGAAGGALAMAASALATTPVVFAACWAAVGVAQACTLYPPAFAAASQWFAGRGAWPLTVITLAGGVSSTALAPVTAWLAESWGWRSAFALLAALYGVVCTAAAALLLSPPWQRPVRTGAAHREYLRAITRSRRFVSAQAALALTGAGLYAVTLTMVPLLQERGFSYRDAAFVFGLVGAGQLLGRLAFLPLSARGTPRGRLVLQVWLSAAALLVVFLASAPAALVVLGAVLVGAVRGAHTLTVATAVSDRWGREAYASVLGRFHAPVAAAIAVSPLLGEVAARAVGSYATATLCFAGLAAAGALLARRT
ncbi:MFS transporter [Geodermatophilus sp. SYSU D00815]